MLSKLILAITLVVSSVMALVSQPEIENVGYPAPLEGYPMEIQSADEFPELPSATPTIWASATPYPLPEVTPTLTCVSSGAMLVRFNCK